MTTPRDPQTAPVMFGAEWFAEPLQQPADPGTTDTYDVPVDILARFQETQKAYLQARAALVGVLERQGWRAPPAAATTEGAHVDLVFAKGPPDFGRDLLEVEDEQRRSIRVGEWLARDDGYEVLRIPMPRAHSAQAPEAP